MSKVLKITKPDKTIHVVPTTHKAFYTAQNNRLPADQKWKIEEIDEKDAKDLPFKDENYVTPGEAVGKVKDLQKTVEDKDAEIEALKAQLAAAQGGSNQPARTAAEVIELINAATSVEQVETLAKGDERVTVKNAADKKIEALKASQN
jgi:hypothetical protein